MHPSKVVKDPKINDTFYDPDVDKLYQYVKIGDFPPEWVVTNIDEDDDYYCLLYTSPSPRDQVVSRMPSSA